jgi:hypothetical protein
MLFAVGHYNPKTKEWTVKTKKQHKSVEEKSREMGQIEMFPS